MNGEEVFWGAVALIAFTLGVFSNEEFRREHRRFMQELEEVRKKVEKRLYKSRQM